MTPTDFLRRVRARLEKPENWTQRAFSRDVNGDALGMLHQHPKAVCWCLEGAFRLEEMLSGDIQLEANKRIIEACGSWPSRFNDAPGRTHAEILAVLDKAIGLVET